MLWYYKGTGEARVHIVPASKSRTLVKIDPTQRESPSVNSVLAFPELLVTAGSLSTQLCVLCGPIILSSFLSLILLFGHLIWTAWRG